MYSGLLFSNEPLFYEIILFVAIVVAICVFFLLFFIPAGYGRHIDNKWSLKIPNRLGWFIMEIPTVVIFALCFIFSDKWSSWTHISFLLIWNAHYVHRVFIYPLIIKNGKKLPVTIISMGFIFNVVNTYLQGRWLFTLSDPQYSSDLLFPLSPINYSNVDWLYSPIFLFGLVLFIVGYFINKQSDLILRNLRTESNQRYKIPNQGLYRFVSCPNYLGELLEWLAWAIMTWSLPGTVFFIWTTANLLPRSISHHKWYHEHFDNYPDNRKALIPFLL
ncbi:MAG: DUF1295 domain-containing protein [Asgard group archaeon]|nr:DUF1295 domain-containing protein [Asgard group archaeon]